MTSNQSAFWLIDQLVQQGVRHFCIAPGSRSAPLALAARLHPDATTLVHYDERGLAFFCLGIALQSRAPAALIVTSGTAPAHALPAVMEAYHAHVPLIVLTADRPHELRETGDNQTTDQARLFAPFTCWQFDFPPLEERLGAPFIRSTAAHAVKRAQQGPVHLNCPFREPFATEFAIDRGSPIQQPRPLLSPRSPIRLPPRGVLFAGKGDDPQALLRLAEKTGWPLCADLLSGLRGASHPHLIRRYHWILKQGLAPDPEAIVHVGARLTSKAALQWIGGKRGIPIIHAHPYPERIDPFHAQTERWQTETLPFVEAVEASPDPSWLEEWRRLDALIERLLEEHPSGRFTESLALQILSQHAPTHAPFFLSASMPVREADLFLFQSRPFFSNRGLSGIDGSIATAAGIAAASAAPVFAFIGDLAALHDLNSLPLLKKHPFTLIISNNGGGGIFLHLPIAQQTPHLQELFVASHSWRFAQAAQMFDLPYAAASNEQELRAALASHVSVIELITDSAQNRAYHETLHHAVAAQKRRPLP